MSSLIKAIRGMSDILPHDTPLWQHVETTLRRVCQQYGYHEIRLPIVEQTALFKRGIGEITDIVEKEMYTFHDRNEESLTLRPEGTASCVRAALEHGLIHNQTQKLWYLGPMFRYERPQKGRYRQFYQFGAEAFGLTGPDIDIELILLTHRLFKALGVNDQLTLELNTLGTHDERQHYREQLVAYFTQHKAQLDEDSTRRLTTNPLRILDSKNPAMRKLLDHAPKLIDHLGPESQQHFQAIQEALTANGLPFRVNTTLVRGLDYYSKTVFEWVTDKLGAQGTVLAGGRYDTLVTTLGGRPTPAIGFSMGMERLILLLQTQSPALMPSQHPDVYLILNGERATAEGMPLAETLRNALPQRAVIAHLGGGNLKRQFKKADKSGASLALILGDEELNNHQISIKYLREDKPQISVSMATLHDVLSEYFSSDSPLDAPQD